MANGEIYEIYVKEETIVASVVEESLQISIVEESLTVDLAPETLNIDLAPEVLDVTINEPNIVVEVEAWCNPCHGGQGTGGGIFITDVTGAGIVSNKLYEPNTVPADRVLTEATTDNDSCTIYFVCEGGTYYSPTITLDGVECLNLVEDSYDKRLFHGSFDVTVTTDTTFLIESSAGTEDACIIHRAALGPEILTCVIGDYPGSQTAAKAGDIIHVTGTVESGATHVRLLNFEAFTASGWIPCSGGSFDITGTVSGASGLNNALVHAKNNFGTEGNTFESSNQILLDQTVPQFHFNNITYPSGQLAFKNTESGFIDVEVTDFTSLTYSSPHGDFTISDPSLYEQNKAITCTNPGDYNDSSTNYRIVALKASNGTSSTYNRVIEIADIAPVVTVTQPYARLRSSETGRNYTITASSNQNLASSPNIGIPVSGTWQGSGFSGGLKTYTRTITITDTDSNGTGAWLWDGSAPTNRAGLSATITGNEVVGGFVTHDLTLLAFGTSVDLNTAVSDTSKLSMTWSFKTNMVFQPIGTTPPVANGWTIDATGINPTSIIILDLQAAAASTQPSTISIQETV